MVDTVEEKVEKEIQKEKTKSKTSRGILAGKIIGGLTTLGGGLYAGVNAVRYYMAEQAIREALNPVIDQEKIYDLLSNPNNLSEFVKGVVCDPHSDKIVCTLYRNAIERFQALDGLYLSLPFLAVGVGLLVGSYFVPRLARRPKKKTSTPE